MSYATERGIGRSSEGTVEEHLPFIRDLMDGFDFTMRVAPYRALDPRQLDVRRLGLRDNGSPIYAIGEKDLLDQLNVQGAHVSTPRFTYELPANFFSGVADIKCNEKNASGVVTIEAWGDVEVVNRDKKVLRFPSEYGDNTLPWIRGVFVGVVGRSMDHAGLGGFAVVAGQ